MRSEETSEPEQLIAVSTDPELITVLIEELDTLSAVLASSTVVTSTWK